MGSKIDVNFERRFFTNRTLAAAGARFARSRGSKLGAQNGVNKGRHLGIDVYRCLVVLGPVLRAKIDQQIDQKTIENL